MTDDVLIRVDNVSKKFCRSLRRSLWYGMQDTVSDLLGSNTPTQGLREDEFWAINDVSFELRRGECLGLIGRNGAGKTTLLKMLNGLIKPDRGRIEMRGRVGALIALGAGFNPILTGRENIYINGSVLGLSKKEIDAKYDEIVDFAEIGDFIDAPVQSYSSGMQVRLGFAVATTIQPDVLLLDEVLAVGDSAFRTKCFDRIGRVLTSAAVIFVSHSEPQIRRICNEALLLSAGHVIEKGSPQKILTIYRRESQNCRPKEARIADERIREFSLERSPRVVRYGSDIEIIATLSVGSECKIGALFIHLWCDEGFVAHGESYLGDSPVILSPGASEIRMKLGPLNLSAGKYTLSIAAFDENYKKTIMHGLHITDVEIEGPVGSGPHHLVPMTIVSTDKRDLPVSSSSLAGAVDHKLAANCR